MNTKITTARTKGLSIRVSIEEKMKLLKWEMH